MITKTMKTDPIKRPSYSIEIQKTAAGQGDEYFFLNHDGERTQIHVHDYDTIFSIPGLYELLFYTKLKCQSPQVVVEMLNSEIADSRLEMSQLSVLDLGAGNGMVAEKLADSGVPSIVGVDISEAAAQAAQRDRPSVYDDYYVADLSVPLNEIETSLVEHDFNCLVSVAALGFNDIPPAAFANAFNIIEAQGWVAFNIKEDFRESQVDDSGFSKLIDTVLKENILELKSEHSYQHRLAFDGTPLYYDAIIGVKKEDIPIELFAG